MVEQALYKAHLQLQPPPVVPLGTGPLLSPGVVCTNLWRSSTGARAEQAIADSGIRKQGLLLPVLSVTSCVCVFVAVTCSYLEKDL